MYKFEEILVEDLSELDRVVEGKFEAEVDPETGIISFFVKPIVNLVYLDIQFNVTPTGVNFD